MAVKTKGTQLFILDATAQGGAEILTVVCATSLSGLGAPREQIETTCLESDDREYVGGLTTPGSLTVSVNYDPSEASHLRLQELYQENVNFKIAIGFGPETDVPTLDSAGTDFDLPTSRSFVVTEGYVADVPLDAALNAVWTSAISIQLSGGYTPIPKVA